MGVTEGARKGADTGSDDGRKDICGSRGERVMDGAAVGVRWCIREDGASVGVMVPLTLS